MIELTNNAKSKILEMAVSDNLKPFIRAGIVGGGCSGYTHKLFFEDEEEFRDTDSIFEFGDVKIIIDMMSMTFLEEVTIDYIDGLMEAGFKLTSPQFEKTCGCGSSFKM